jgi:amicyanin
MARIPVPVTLLSLVLVIVLVTCGCTGTAPAPAQQAAVQAPSTTTQAGNAVTIQNFAFSPATITVPGGTTVTWTNQDSMQHDVVNLATGPTAQGAYFKSEILQKGGAYSFTFDTPGTYPYFCSIHPSMKGTVIVT